MLKHGVLLFILVMGTIAPSFAVCQPDSTTRVSVAEKQSLLWKISGNNLKKPSYLFGTIHLLCPQDYVWTQAMRRSLQQCTQVCFEMDMDDPAVMMSIAMGMTDQSGAKLKDYFSTEQYAVFEQYAKDSLKLELTSLQQLKPAALLNFFSVKFLSCPTPISYESKIQQEAEKTHKEIVGLEEPSEQIALLDSLPADSVIADIMETVTGQPNDDQSDYANLIAAYKKQDLAELYNLILQVKGSTNSFNAFLDERNMRWVSRMEGYMEQKPVFFAVGAGHLWSEYGLINLLRNAGYTVTAVR